MTKRVIFQEVGMVQHWKRLLAYLLTFTKVEKSYNNLSKCRKTIFETKDQEKIIYSDQDYMKNSTANIITNGELLKAFFLRLGMVGFVQGWPLLPLLFHSILVILATEIKPKS